MSTALAIAWLDAAAWGYLLLARGGFWKVQCDDDSDFPAEWPDITAIVPARNEADTLPGTLPSLLATNPSLRVVLVDDRSEDGTAQIAKDIAAKAGAAERLTVIAASPTPAGWKGKVWAMQCGLDHVAAQPQPPRYILFTDADIAYDPGALPALAARAEAGQLALTSLMVKLRCQSTAEQWLIPAFVYFFRMLYPFRWVNEGHIAAAAGGCMLVRRDALLQAGGLYPIRGALIDDCALGRLMQTQGRIWLGLTRRVHSLRPYPRINDIRAMVSRTAYDQLNYSPLNLAASLLGLALIYLGPVWLSLYGTGFARFLGMLSWAAMGVSFVPMLRFYRRPRWQAVFLPGVALGYMGFTLNSAWQYARGRGGMWKGRAQAARQAA